MYIFDILLKLNLFPTSIHSSEVEKSLKLTQLRHDIQYSRLSDLRYSLKLLSSLTKVNPQCNINNNRFDDVVICLA